MIDERFAIASALDDAEEKEGRLPKECYAVAKGYGAELRVRDPRWARFVTGERPWPTHVAARSWRCLFTGRVYTWPAEEGATCY